MLGKIKQILKMIITVNIMLIQMILGNTANLNKEKRVKLCRENNVTNSNKNYVLALQ